MKTAIVIGSGLGGLEVALILLRHGYEVTVLEKGRQAGGCLQSFVRDGRRFDTGFHYVGGLGEGEPLGRCLPISV
jgi:phytoene dehydrogenase-like protein